MLASSGDVFFPLKIPHFYLGFILFLFMKKIYMTAQFTVTSGSLQSTELIKAHPSGDNNLFTIIILQNKRESLIPNISLLASSSLEIVP